MTSRVASEQHLCDPLLKETISHRKLACGLDVYAMARPGFWRKHAIFTTRYGSIDSEFEVPGSGAIGVPAGIAHFLEHEVFEEDEGSAFEAFAALGASANAFTSYNNTTYLFTTTEGFEECLRFLLTFVGRLSLSDEKVSRERSVIEQELRMYEDIPRFKVQSNLMQALFHKHPVRIDIGGTVESVNAIKRDDLELCHSTFYHPGNMMVFATGDLDPGDTLDLVEDTVYSTGVWNLTPRPSPQRLFPHEPETALEKRVNHSMLVSQPLLYIGIKDIYPGLTGDQMLRVELVTSVLLEMLLGWGSDLYTSLYEEGLLDDKFSAGFMGEKDYGVTIIGGQTPDPARLEARILEGFRLIGEAGLEEEDFERIKRKMAGEFLGVFNQPEELAQVFNHHYLRGVSLFDYPSALESITLAEVAQRFKDLFDPSKRSVSAVYPRT